jgi:HlyD family secretion protein
MLALLAAVGYVVYDRYLARPAVPPVAGTPVQVRRASLRSTVGATGSVVTTRQSRLTMQVAGRLKELPVKLGDEVKAGAVLARVDTAPLELKLAQSRSSLRTAQVKLDQLKAGARPEEVAQAEASVQVAQGKLSDLQAGTIPQEIAAAQAQASNAAAQIRQAQARLDGLRRGATPGEISTAEQALATAQAAVQTATSNLQKAEIELARVQDGPRPEDIRQQELAVEQARNSLYAKQTNRDAVCGRGAGGPCDSAKADVFAAESAVTQANVKLQALKAPPDQKDIGTAQANLDNAREQLRSAQEGVRATQVRLDQLKAGPTVEDVRQGQAAIEAAQATFQQASARVAALQAGAKPGEIQAAQAAVSQAEQQLALRRAPTTASDLALAEEQVNLAQLIVQQTQLDIENATLIAPFDGVVGALSANVGEQVGAQSAILTLVDPKSTRVDVSVDETDVAKVTPGKVAQVSFDAIPGRQFAGKVVGIAPTATVMQGLATYTVSIGVDDPEFFKLAPPGLTATVGIVVAEKNDALVIPSRAIKRPGRNPSVDLYVGDRAEARQIKTGLADGQMTEVVEGLTESDTVLIPAMSTVAPRGAQPPTSPLVPGAPRPPAKV